MIKEIVPLRFLLILMIFFHHAVEFQGGGASAVAFFFVLSGFCMTLGYRNIICSNEFSYISYIKKRCVRFYPLHWITLLTVILLAHGIEGRRKLILNAALLQSWVPDMDYYFSFNSVSWFLSTLMLSIFIFPIVINFIERLNKKDKVFFACLLACAYCIFALNSPSAERHPLLYIHPATRVVDFILGVYVGYLFVFCSNNDKCKQWTDKHNTLLDILFVCSLCVFISIGVLAKTEWRTIAGIYWVPIVICLLSLTLGSNSNSIMHRFLRNKYVLWLTRCSFSMMLWHTIIIGHLFDTLPPPLCIVS